MVDVFPDMIARSVPGYASMLAMIEQLTERYATPGSHLYDLGCSLGAATRLIQAIAPPDCVVHAVDNSPAMVERLSDLLEESKSHQSCRVEIHLADICDIAIERASLIVLNFTLQFIPLSQRASLLENIFNGLDPGGALLLSEKICFENVHQQNLLTQLHQDFKRAHGYSDLEIAQKRTALENRLIPESMDEHCQRLAKVGFAQVVPWFQCFNFASILAVKA